MFLSANDTTINSSLHALDAVECVVKGLAERMVAVRLGFDDVTAFLRRRSHLHRQVDCACHGTLIERRQIYN